MADDNDDKTTASDSGISDADLLAALGDHLPPETDSSDDAGEVNEPEETEEVTAESTTDQPSGENAEEEEAGEAEPEGESDTGEETEEEEPPKGQRDMLKRIDKLTAIRKGLEEENSVLKERLEKAQPIKLSPTADDPLADLNTDQELQERRQQMVDLSRWCYENLDGGEVEQNGKVVEYTPKEVRQRLAIAQEHLGVNIPAREKYLQQRAAWDNATKTVYPSLFDSNTDESRIANVFLHQCPAIMKVPNYQMIIGDAIEGMKLRLAKAQVAAKPPKKEQIAPRATKPSQPPLKVASKANGNPRLRQRFSESGSQKDLAALIESTL